MPAKRTKSQRRPRKPAASGRGDSSGGPATPPIIRDILARTRSAGFQRYLRDLLVGWGEINTTPNADVTRMEAAENGCFRILEWELSALAFPGPPLERRPVNPAI